jgi:AcrR family transcriptional regulator
MRSERSRAAIIESALSFMEEGHLVPTAQLIAERAGVGIRSFFRHFPDMETLFAAVDNETRESTEALFTGGDRDGSKNYARYQRGLRKDLENWLPELKKMEAGMREAVDAIASFEMWHRLREHQGLSKKAAMDIVVDLLSALIRE